MSRFYNIVVGAETSPQIATGGQTAASGNTGAVWTNFVGGKADLGAQTVEFDISSFTFDTPISAGMVKIWGPTKQQISQASDFNGAPIQVFAGMQNGLPLASADVAAGQQGLIASGQIYQAFGNWQGINQTLDFVILYSATGTQASPANISVNWKKGQPLADVIRTVLTTAFPTFLPPKINISPNLVLAQDEAHTNITLTQLSQYVRGVSQNIIKTNSDGTPYPGVSIAPNGNQLIVFDGTQATGNLPTAILTQDLIGQVTWLDVAKVQFNTVMRADFVIGSAVTFPPIAGLTAITNVQSNSNVRAKNTFSGVWNITSIRHIGNSRAPDAQSWISTFEAVSNLAPQSEFTGSEGDG